MRTLLIGLSIFGFLHTIRDALQIKGVWNWFTLVGHFWDKPEWEKYSATFSLLFGIFFLLLAAYY